MEIYDISQTIREGIAVWPGDQQFRRQWKMRLAKGQSCNLSSVTMSVHTGTHLDAPYHFDDAGTDIASVSLTRYVGRARVVAMSVDRHITARDLALLAWDGVERILFKTRAADAIETEFDPRFVYLSEDGAEFIGKRNMLLVGTDAPSVDGRDSRGMLAHKTLLKHGVAILEGVRLAQVPDGDYELICLPLKLAGADGSPVRAILRR